jgi:hypothetical protein
VLLVRPTERAGIRAEYPPAPRLSARRPARASGSGAAGHRQSELMATELATAHTEAARRLLRGGIEY